jgi:hypothetical protein
MFAQRPRIQYSWAQMGRLVTSSNVLLFHLQLYGVTFSIEQLFDCIKDLECFEL